MQPMNVFVAGEGITDAWSVTDWDEAWQAITHAFRVHGDDSAPLAWAVTMTEGYGPVTVLYQMTADIWAAVAEDARALSLYCLIGDVEPDGLLPRYADGDFVDGTETDD